MTPAKQPQPCIAIDYTPAYEQSAGIGRYVRELVNALSLLDEETQYRLFVAGTKQHITPPADNFSCRTTRITPKWLARVWHRLQVPLPVTTFTGQIDLFHATDFVLPPTSAHTLLTVHDLSYVRVPDAASPRLKQYLDRVVPRSVKKADHILADSQATKDDLIAIYDTPADKITVLLSGVDSRFQVMDAQYVTLQNRYNLPPGPFLLSVGTIQPRKNYTRLIYALHRLRQQGFDLDLVIAGGKGWLDGPMYQAIDATNQRSRIHLIGFVDDDDLLALYNLAYGFVFPSLYEGFGLPVLESMACGTPVLTSSVSSLPEVAGDAAIIVDPYDLDELTNGLRQLVDDATLRQTLIKRGLERVKQFTWGRAARQLQAVYRMML